MPNRPADDSTAPHPQIHLVETSFLHPPGRCGERVPSPHPRCQAKLEPYRAAERFGSILLCQCGTSWRLAA